MSPPSTMPPQARQDQSSTSPASSSTREACTRSAWTSSSAQPVWGKATVYRLFASKDDLIGAYLQRRADHIHALIDADIERHRSNPKSAIRALFAAVAEDVARESFRGCAFNNASIEFADPAHPARRVAREYRAGLRQRLCTVARALLPGRAAAELADELALVIDGMYTSAARLGPTARPNAAPRSPAASSTGTARKAAVGAKRTPNAVLRPC